MKNYSYLCNRFGHFAQKKERSFAPVAELVDAPDLGSGVSRRAGSSPVRRTKYQRMGKYGLQTYHKRAILIEKCSF